MSDPINANKFFFHDEKTFLYHDVKRVIGEVSGVYYIHATDENREFKPLPRLLDVDINGILYIGTAGKLHERLGEVQKAISVAYDRKQWTNSRHGLLDKMKRLSRFRDAFPYSTLCVTVRPLSTAIEGDPDTDRFDDHYALERHLLNDYRLRYGDYPVFNVQ